MVAFLLFRSSIQIYVLGKNALYIRSTDMKEFIYEYCPLAIQKWMPIPELEHR
jgi:hypothetical protein